MITDFDIAIVGGGAAATACLLAMAALPNAQELRVLWVAPAACDGRGIAYGTRDAMHRLNVRAFRMSARADVPNDFVDFLTERFGHADPQGFYPRRCYGDYLAQRASAAWQGLNGERWDTCAQHLSHDGDAWILTGGDNMQRRARHLLLALGPLPQQTLTCVDTALLQRGTYRSDPYGWAAGSQAKLGMRQIWIIGSGLTAVDLALTAVQQHSDAQIHLISRHGALPAVHGPAHAALTDLFGAELQLPSVSEVLRRLRGSMANLSDWRAGIDSLRALTADRWQHWPAVEQRRFLRHLRWVWDCARHRMAPEVAAAIEALQCNGRLEVHRGRVLAIRADQQNALLHWRARGEHQSRVSAADLVLQATGLNTGVKACASPLLRSLLDSGLAYPDALNMGLAVDAQQRLIGNHGVRDDAHVIGALARGSRFECIAMPEIRNTAAAIARELLDRWRQAALNSQNRIST